MDIVRARPEDAELLTRIAIASKRHWGYPDEWMTRWGNALTLTPDYVERNEVHAAVVEKEIAGFYALVNRAPIVILDHLWIVPGRIRTGIGRELFQHALARAAALGAEWLEWEAEPNAVGFYERMGGRHLRDIISDFGRTLPIMGIQLRTE